MNQHRQDHRTPIHHPSQSIGQPFGQDNHRQDGNHVNEQIIDQYRADGAQIIQDKGKLQAGLFENDQKTEQGRDLSDAQDSSQGFAHKHLQQGHSQSRQQPAQSGNL